MEVENRPVVISDLDIESLENIYAYGIETFSRSSATVFIEELYVQINLLSSEYLHHPICRFIPTKTGIYRNLQHGRYFVIYRIKPERIEVLNIIHSPTRIRAVRKIKI
jgi:plasmid stabilization system protein ParE